MILTLPCYGQGGIVAGAEQMVHPKQPAGGTDVPPDLDLFDKEIARDTRDGGEAHPPEHLLHPDERAKAAADEAAADEAAQEGALHAAEGAAEGAAPNMNMNVGGGGPAEDLLERCRELGLTESQADELSGLGMRAVLEVYASSGLGASIGMRALVTFAALGRGDFKLADSVLDLPGEANTPELRLLDLAARLYRACVGAERDPGKPLALMNALTEALVPVIGLQTAEARLSRGYAGLTLSEALLRLGDVGAARQQLESVADEPGMPPAIAVIAGMMLGGLEQSVGRNDLALGHIQVALHRASQLGAIAEEERLLRVLLVGLLMFDSRRYGLAMLDDITAGKYGPAPSGHGTVARLYRVLSLIAREPPLSLAARASVREDLRWLQGRHNSAGWSLLVVSLVAGAMAGADDACEAYGLLVQASAELRCRYMDGVADLCDRQIAALRHQLGPDCFDELLTEAQRRRQQLLSVLRESADC